MTLKLVGVFAALGALALALSPVETIAKGGGGGGGGGAGGRGGPGAHSMARPPIAVRPFAHRRGFGGGGFWPGGGYYYGDGPYSAPLTDVGLPLSNEINQTYTYKNDVPWDWAHRFPPNVVPSDRPYVPNCSSEAVTVPGSSGAEQTVNVMRCY